MYTSCQVFLSRGAFVCGLCGLLRRSRTTNTTGCSCLLPDPAYKQAVTAAPIAPGQVPSAIFFRPISSLCARSPTTSLLLTLTLTRYSPLSSPSLSSPYPSPLRFLSPPPLSSFASFRSLYSPTVHLGGLLSGTRRSGVGDRLQRRLTHGQLRCRISLSASLLARLLTISDCIVHASPLHGSLPSRLPASSACFPMPRLDTTDTVHSFVPGQQLVPASKRKHPVHSFRIPTIRQRTGVPTRISQRTRARS